MAPRPSWVSDSGMRLLGEPMELPDEEELYPMLPTHDALGPQRVNVPGGFFFLAWALRTKMIQGVPRQHCPRTLYKFWIVRDRSVLGGGSTWVFTRTCKTTPDSSSLAALRRSPTSPPPTTYTIVDGNWKRWDAFMDTTWEDLLEKGARFVPNEDYMRPDGTHKFFDRYFETARSTEYKKATIYIAIKPNTEALAKALDDNMDYQTTLLREDQIRTWHRLNEGRRRTIPSEDEPDDEYQDDDGGFDIDDEDLSDVNLDENLHDANPDETLDDADAGADEILDNNDKDSDDDNDEDNDGSDDDDEN